MSGDGSGGNDQTASLPADSVERVALAERLASSADNDSDAFTREETASVVALLAVEETDARVAAAEAIQHLHDRPSLLEPFVEELLAAAESYPGDVDSIPAPVEWMGSADLRTVVYVADSLARVARERPGAFAPYADEIVETLRGDGNAPRYLLFVLGHVEADEPGTVPRAWLKEELCGLLDRGHGNGFPSWAASTLGRLGDADVRPALREAHPGDSGDDPTREAFDEALAALGGEGGDGDAADG
jgi:hypothetical protein